MSKYLNRVLRTEAQAITDLICSTARDEVARLENEYYRIKQAVNMALKWHEMDLRNLPVKVKFELHQLLVQKLQGEHDFKQNAKVLKAFEELSI